MTLHRHRCVHSAMRRQLGTTAAAVQSLDVNFEARTSTGGDGAYAALLQNDGK